jgi:predicted dehydrogenase
MTMPKRIAVIDVSHWHSTYDASYLRILQSLERDIVGVSDRDAAIAADRAARFNSVPFTDYREMIERTKPEFVIALGRHSEMPETFRYLVGAGVPFIMEKPWGVDAETVAGLVRLAEEKGAWVGAPFFTRTMFWAQEAKRRLEAGEFGRLSHMVFRMIRPTMQRYVEWDSPWMNSLAVAGGGSLVNLGSHGFDIARFITGEEPEVVSAVISNAVHQEEVEDYAHVTLRFPSGLIFHNEVGYTMPTWPKNSTDGEQKVAGERLLLRTVPQGVHLLAPNRDEVVAPPEGFQSGFGTIVRETLEAYGRGEPPPVGPRELLQAVRLIHQAYAIARPRQPQQV